VAERLQKWLASAGCGSRRGIERLIAEGRIQVNGKVAELGQKVSGREHIVIDGRTVPATRSAKTNLSPEVLIYHKPAGEICSRADPQGRPSVFDALPRLSGRRWVSVGRLDLQTSGLMIFTTDGELANTLMHPSSGFEREYAVRVRGEVTDDTLRKLRRGVELDDGLARFERLDAAGGEGQNRWYHVVVTEGRHRVVRRLWEAVDCRVSRLIRVRFGPVVLPRSLPRGRSESLTGKRLARLLSTAGIETTPG